MDRAQGQLGVAILNQGRGVPCVTACTGAGARGLRGAEGHLCGSRPRQAGAGAGGSGTMPSVTHGRGGMWAERVDGLYASLDR